MELFQVRSGTVSTRHVRNGGVGAAGGGDAGSAETSGASSLGLEQLAFTGVVAGTVAAPAAAGSEVGGTTSAGGACAAPAASGGCSGISPAHGDAGEASCFAFCTDDIDPDLDLNAGGEPSTMVPARELAEMVNQKTKNKTSRKLPLLNSTEISKIRPGICPGTATMSFENITRVFGTSPELAKAKARRKTCKNRKSENPTKIKQHVAHETRT